MGGRWGEGVGRDGEIDHGWGWTGSAGISGGMEGRVNNGISVGRRRWRGCIKSSEYSEQIPLRDEAGTPSPARQVTPILIMPLPQVGPLNSPDAVKPAGPGGKRAGLHCRHGLAPSQTTVLLLQLKVKFDAKYITAR